MKKFLVFALLLLNFQTESSHPPNYIESGDNFFMKMKYKEAIEAYSKLSDDPQAQWKIARANLCIADTIAKDQKEKYIQAAEKASRNCIRVNPNLSEGHTWLAASLGNRAMFEGSKTKVKLCNEIKAELDKAIKLNPKDDLAYSILGTFHRSIGKINWLERQLAEVFIGSIPAGGFAEGEKALKNAVTLAPQTVRHWYELGNLYLEWDKEQNAVIAFEAGVKLPAQVVSDYRRLKEMKAYLEENK